MKTFKTLKTAVAVKLHTKNLQENPKQKQKTNKYKRRSAKKQLKKKILARIPFLFVSDLKERKNKRIVRIKTKISLSRK